MKINFNWLLARSRFGKIFAVLEFWDLKEFSPIKIFYYEQNNLSATKQFAINSGGTAIVVQHLFG